MFLRKQGQTWYLNWSEGGKQRSKAIHRYFGLPHRISSRTDAKLLFEKALREKVRMVIGNLNPNLTLREVLTQWLRNTEPYKTKRTIETDYQRVHFFLKFFESQSLRFVRDLSHETYRGFLSSLSCKSITANHYTRTISAGLTWAVKENILAFNPLKNFKLFPQDLNPANYIISSEDLKTLFDSPKPFSDLIKLSYFCLLRRSEVSYLTGDDIDFKNKRLIIQPKENFTPKNRKTRVIPLSEKALEIVQSSNSGRLFPNYSPDYISHHWTKLRKKLKIKARFHDLRHTAATNLLESGISPKAVQELLGHSTIDTTMRIYSHVSKKHLEEAVRKL